jgi:predicted dehydrogenase
MYLNAEERQVGRENFFAAIGSPFVPRRQKAAETASRDVLQKAVGQAAAADPKDLAAALRAAYFGYAAPSEPLRVGLIGCGDQGRRLIDSINPKFMTVVSIADTNPKNVERAIGAEGLAAKPPKPVAGLTKLFKDWKGATYGDYHDLLAAKEKDKLQAVIIALPTKLHAEAAVAALNAGLHVFLESPLAPSVAECKELVRIVEAKNKDKKAAEKLCVAVGQQRRYSLLYDNAVALVRSGLLGKVHCLQLHWNCDKDAWNASAGGLMTQLGSHLIEAATMFLGAARATPDAARPLSVAGAGAQSLDHSAGDANDHAYCVLEYPAEGYAETEDRRHAKKIGVQCALVCGSSFDGYGELVLGTDGTLVLDSEQDALLYKVAATERKLRVVARTKRDPKTNEEKPMPPGLDPKETGDEASSALGRAALIGADAGYAAELEHWAWCVRNPADENQPRSTPADALTSAAVALAAEEAIRQSTRPDGQAKRIDFKEEWFDAGKDDTPEGAKPDVARYKS